MQKLKIGQVVQENLTGTTYRILAIYEHDILLVQSGTGLKLWVKDYYLRNQFIPLDSARDELGREKEESKN